ncbi:MAG: hypothetical protein IPO78_04555 [Saprospiraceae bacterium]|nr:hypothetical protein [Saprospiraceae bacterium]
MNNQEDKIEAYLLGQMTDSELQEFENELKTNQDLARLVDQHKAIIKRLEAYRINTKVKSILEYNSQQNIILNLKRIIGIAASFLIVILGSWFFIFRKDSIGNGQMAQENINQNQQKTDSLSIKNNSMDTIENLASIEKLPIESPSTEIIERRKIASVFIIMPMLANLRELENQDSTNVLDPFDLAKAEFKIQNYKEVLSYLDNLKIPKDDEELLFIRAISYFKMGIYYKATVDFNLLKRSYQFKAEADFNFMLCQLAQNNIQATKQLINSMIDDQDFQFRDQAIALKSKINLE